MLVRIQKKTSQGSWRGVRQKEVVLLGEILHEDKVRGETFWGQRVLIQAVAVTIRKLRGLALLLSPLDKGEKTEFYFLNAENVFFIKN